MKIDLPDGEWANLRDPKKVPERLRRPILRLIAASHASGDMDKLQNADIDDEEQVRKLVAPEWLDLVGDLDANLALALIDQWSFDTEISLDAILDLPGDAYDVIAKAVTPMLNAVIPDFGVSRDPKALTGNSSD